jgi:hypothetical protein
MPKDRVHAVGHDEAIRVEESGKAVITSCEEASSETKDLADDLVLAPGGYRPKSLVHLIEPDHVLNMEDGLLQELHPSGKVVADFWTDHTSPSR